MEEEIIGGRRHPPPPPLLFLRGKNHNNNIAFSSFGDLKTHFTKEKPQELHNKTFQAYRNGWFILLDSYSPHQFFKIYKYTLWNPSTSEFIHLPQLDLKGEKTIKSCTLSSAPGNPNCMLILFETKVPSIIFCRIGVEDKHWKHQNLGEEDYLFGHVMLNGTLYSSTRMGRLVKLDLDCPNNDRLGLTLLDDCFMPCSQENSPTCARYMVEFCGEIFLIYLVIKGSYNSACQVIDVEVFTLDFSNMVWCEVRGFKDKAFFVGPYSSFSYSCPVTSNEHRGIRGNHVYFTLPNDESLYSFNMGEKTISVSLPCSSNLKPSMKESQFSWRTPIWIMPDLSLAIRVNNTKAKGDSHEAKPHENGEISKRARLDQVEGEFSNLPIELLIAISEILLPQDNINFTTLITRLPLIPWNQYLASQDSNNSLKPWLMVLTKGDLNCNFTNLWGAKCRFEIDEDQFKNITVACSTEGWCLMLGHGNERSIFLWNPLTNKTIHLPDMRHKREQLFSFGFSLSPIKKVVLMGSYRNCYIFIDYISLEEKRWWRYLHVPCFNIPNSVFPASSFISNTMTFSRGAFYILNKFGDLFVFGDETRLELVNVAKEPFPSSFHQSFLVECGGKLLSVMVGFLGEWVRIFQLDESDLVWHEVKDLGQYTLYVSHYASLAVVALPGSEMANRIYFSRFYGRNVVYYSFRSERLHVHDSEKVLDNFYHTKEQLLSTWIRPLACEEEQCFLTTRRLPRHRYHLRNMNNV